MPQNNIPNTLNDKLKTNELSGFKEEAEPKKEPLDAPKTEETVVEKAAHELHLELPDVNLPLTLKIIALLTAVGGLSIIANSFTNIFSPDDIIFFQYIVNLITGILFIIISYGIIRRQNWATWLYGLLVFIGLFVNWVFSIFPALIVIYLVFNKKYFYQSVFDKLLIKFSIFIQSRMK